MKLYKILIFIIIIAFGSLGFAKPRVSIGDNNPIIFPKASPDAVVIQRVFLNANNISAYFQNTGIFDQNTTSGNLAGFEWPKGSGKTACFTAGLCIGCYITDKTGTPKLGEVMASYKGEYSPGAVKVSGGIPSWDNDPKFKMYVVRAGDNSSNNPDYDKWTLMIPYGAPFVDNNNNGIYDPGIDVPGQKNAGETIFLCMTDADASNRSSGEGFGGGINKPLLYAEIHFTAWAYNTPGLEDLQFVNWVVINKGDSAWRRTYTGVVVDADLGDANDDYIGCDTVNKINLGYTYNATNNDAQYGIAPPAFGMDYFKSPIIRKSGLPDDTLGLTSFSFFTNTSTAPPPCESDPNGESYPAYLDLKGTKKDGSPFLDPTQSPPSITKFCYPGDPETGIGWTEYKGSIQNCGGLTGPTISTNPKGDRRFIFCSGKEDFTVNPGDTQNIVLAQFVARGSSNLNSVTKLKSLAKTAKLIYLSNFNVTPPPPGPVATASYTPLNNGQCNIVLSWDDKAETYRYWDTIFYQKSDSNIYNFEGYEVYEINKFANSVPDFTKPETIDLSQAILIDIFDKKDGVGGIVDTFSTGVTINNQEQFAPYPIVPPYKMPSPGSFPDKGISRGITLTGTKYSQNYGGVSSFVYGQEYQFAVVAYAISRSTTIKRGFKVIRNSLSAQIIKIRPITPPAGTVFTLHNGDTIATSSRDLGCMPIVRNQDLLLNATYRLIFNPLTDLKDTTYNILRKKDGFANYDTIKTKLKYIEYISALDDSSRTMDGILFKMQKIRFKDASPNNPDGATNVGVIKDLNRTKGVGPDSAQARLSGWEYKPANHQYLTGSKYKYDPNKPWQSESMSLAYPCKNVYIDVSSKLPANKLRKVKIVFSNTNNQYAYRYIDTLNSSGLIYWKYENLVQVPFKVYESDYTDSTSTDVQLNCGFIESGKINPITGTWHPTADSLGGRLQLVIFGSNYDTSRTDYKFDGGGQPLNLFFMGSVDVMYAWAPKLVTDGATFVENDEFWIYPYYNTVPYLQGNLQSFYEFHVTAPKYGDVTVAKSTNALDNIRVVPNPYYGFSTLDRSTSDKFVTFRNLPLQCTIKIYTLNGDLIQTLVKSNTGNTATSSTIEWNLQNMERTPVASGVYVALIDAPNIGTKVIKLAVFTSQERINF
jgi:hypothetical protein